MSIRATPAIVSVMIVCRSIVSESRCFRDGSANCLSKSCLSNCGRRVIDQQPRSGVVDDLIGSERAGAAVKSRKFDGAVDDMICVYDDAGDMSATIRMRMSKPYVFGGMIRGRTKTSDVECLSTDFAD